MKKTILLAVITCLLFATNHETKSSPYQSNQVTSDTLPVRGFEIAAPRPTGVDSFVSFIKKE